MRRALVILGVVAAIPVVVLGGAFVYGMVLGATGRYVPEEANEEPRAESDRAGATTGSEQESTPSDRALVPPAELDAAGARDWLLATHVVSVVEGVVVGDRAGFASMAADDAIRVHAALRSGESEFEALRVVVFALFGELPVEARRRFADAVGAVHPPKGSSGERGYFGDFTRLLFHVHGDPDSLHARGVRAFAAVLEDREMVDALKDIGALYEEPPEGTWRIRVEEKLADFDADTIMAIHDAIGTYLGLGDRKYVRAQLRELAESKRSN
ncbi:MAG: hypothetical protein R3F34_05070 [Planctomycetota bacterium]